MGERLNTLLAMVCSLVCLAVSCSGDVPIARLEDERRPASRRLIAALGSGSVERRARAALAMGRIQSAAYAGPLAAASQSGEGRVRRAALFALGQLGLARGVEVPDVAVTSCIDALLDPDPRTVATAVEALGKLADPRVPPAVVPYLRHADPQLRAAAAVALFRCRFAPLWRGQVDSPPPLPADALEALLDTLEDEDPAVRRRVAYAFSRYGQDGAAAQLSVLLDDEDELTRLFAVRAIGHSDDASATTALVRVLQDRSAGVRTEAVSALAALGRPDAAGAILESDVSFHVRAAVARALAESESLASLETLHRYALDPSTTVRAAAISGLAQRLGGGYRELLAQHLEDADWRIRRAAATAAGHLGSDGASLVTRAMQDLDNRVRTAALEALQIAGGGDEWILQSLTSPDLAVRGTAVSVLEQRDHPQKLERLSAAYEASAGVDWIEIREAVVDAVADLDGAVPLLRRIARQDSASSVRGKARAALADLGLELPEAAEPVPESSPFLDVRFERDPVVLLETSKGEIEIRCFADDAPIHVASFVKLVREGFYDGLIWHRVVSNFVIQGGDPRGDGWGSAGFTLRDEINTRRYGRGAVGMPKAGKDTGGCQLFITHIPTPHLDGNYTIFGQVISGMQVVDAIEVGDSIVRARLR